MFVCDGWVRFGCVIGCLGLFACVGFVGLDCSAAVLLVVFRLGCCFLGLGGGVGFLVVSVVGCLHYCCGFLLFSRVDLVGNIAASGVDFRFLWFVLLIC